MSHAIPRRHVLAGMKTLGFAGLAPVQSILDALSGLDRADDLAPLLGKLSVQTNPL